MHRFAMIMTCLLAVGCGVKEPRQGGVSTIPESAKEMKPVVVKQEAPGEALPYVIEPAKPGDERRKLLVQREISYGELADLLGTSVEILNKLNKMTLEAGTLLAKGSQLYVPGLSPWS